MPDVGEIVLPLYDAERKRWVMSHRRGRVFDVEGRTIELFPLKVLARAIARTPQAVKLWEHDKRFPEPMFKVPAGNKVPTRYYSKVQIANIRALYKKYDTRKRGIDGFLREVWKVFYKLELTEDAKGGDVL